MAAGTRILGSFRMMSLKFIDFFAGVGGFRKGMELAGHECVGFCEFDKFAYMSYVIMHTATDEQREYIKGIKAPIKKNGELNLSSRQKELLGINGEVYRNGEWYANDIRTVDARSLPTADVWCFGFPCQDISIAGKQCGFKGNRSSLFFAVTRLLRAAEEKSRPKYLFIENVKNLLSVNRGFDFARLLVELDEIGYDAEWQVLNSKNFGVPQNRERVFIIGHLREASTSEVFPVSGTAGENSVRILGHRNGYRRNTQVFNPNGIAEALDTCQGGGREPHVVSQNQDVSGVAIPVLTPDRGNKRQNGRRFKENGEPMFTLTGQDRHGVMVNEVSRADGIYTNVSSGFQGGPLTGLSRCLKSEKHDVGVVLNLHLSQDCRIRRLTPRECWRLQAWPDEYFDRANIVNSDSQLYKQAGNGVTVSVIQAIAIKLK